MKAKKKVKPKHSKTKKRIPINYTGGLDHG